MISILQGHISSSLGGFSGSSLSPSAQGRRIPLLSPRHWLLPIRKNIGVGFRNSLSSSLGSDTNSVCPWETFLFFHSGSVKWKWGTRFTYLVSKCLLIPCYVPGLFWELRISREQTRWPLRDLSTSTFFDTSRLPSSHWPHSPLQ